MKNGEDPARIFGNTTTVLSEPFRVGILEHY